MRHIFLCLLLCACPPSPKPPEPLQGCAGACEHMRQLDCELGRVTPAGATCEQVCEAAQANGVNFNTACVASAPSCKEADDC